MNKQSGFTLIEVLLALAVIAIALTALLKANSQNIVNNARLKDKTISHWIAMQGINMVQLGVLSIPAHQEITEVSTLFGERWYWRAKLLNTPIRSMQAIQVTLSKSQNGPFSDPHIGFKYNNDL